MTSRVFIFGDGIDTDQLAPGQYMKGGIEALAAHCLESVRPGFASDVQHGDIIVAGSNFGLGSSREQAAEALRHLGVQAVIAKSFAGIFYRNAINLGLPALTSDNTDLINDGDQVELDIANARLVVTASGKALSLDAVPPNIQQLLDDGGLVAHLKKRFAHEKKQ